MVINGVSFNDEACLGMGRKAFVKAHEGSFFLDRGMADRRRILCDAYDIMERNHGDDSGSAERYLNNPCETAPEELLTEIYIPVE